MGASIILSLIAVVVSVAAFVSTTYLTVRNQRISRQVSYIPTFLKLMDEFRRPEFHDRYSYVVYELQREYDTQSGIGLFDIPEPARTAVLDVVYYYQNAVAFVAFGLLDESKMSAMLYTRLIAVWESIEPYVLVERTKDERSDPYLLSRLEKYAKKAKAAGQEKAIAGFAK